MRLGSEDQDRDLVSNKTCFLLLLLFLFVVFFTVNSYSKQKKDHTEDLLHKDTNS